MGNQENDKLWGNLELLTKCQACDGKLVGTVYLCGSGHSICNTFTNKGTVCVCHARYTNIPNLQLQYLLSQFDNLKVYLQELNDDSDKKSQNSIAAIKNNSNDSSDSEYVNKYRCWIGNDCRFVADVSKIIQHFKNDHIDEFEEDLKENFPFMKSYEMDYAIGNYLDRGIKIGKLIFIIHISINDEAELGSCILSYTSRKITDQYKFLIRVECDNFNSKLRNAEIVNANNSPDSPERVNLDFKRFSLQVARNKQLYKSLEKNKRFKCTVMIEKKSKGNIRKSISNDDKKLTSALVPVEVSEPLSGIAEEIRNKSNFYNSACVLM